MTSSKLVFTLTTFACAALLGAGATPARAGSPSATAASDPVLEARLRNDDQIIARARESERFAITRMRAEQRQIANAARILWFTRAPDPMTYGQKDAAAGTILTSLRQEWDAAAVVARSRHELLAARADRGCAILSRQLARVIAPWRQLDVVAALSD